ncbi:glycosyltransferase family 61 protein [Novacetimonas hansenii]|uniref:Glycosyltransferase family 61 protein n=1 Tax=Novacetimonas hansenii TaxID=436 RepID=A0AAW5EM73_NOVHA|nr:glycosyltransferase family 61 protein [Novacetimonas hansenii]MCJ8352839.1 glycosyltransferase family 61 protein [Novacetimonas hansenii]
MISCIDITKAGGSICQSFVSPEFHTSPPFVVNKEYIPPNIVQAMDKGWCTRIHQKRHVNVYHIKNVFVTEEGLVLTSKGDVLQQSITQHSNSDLERALYNITNKSPIHIHGKTLLLRKRGDTNYGHWNVEVLPKLWLIDGVIEFQNLFLPRGGAEMNRVYRDSISYSTKNEYNKIYACKEDVYKIDDLILIDGMTKHGTYMSPLAFSRTDDIVKKVPGSGLKKVFISREGCLRNINEEEALLKIINGMGFVKINPKNLSYIEQVRYLKDANIVVGVLGAGLTNIMFCKKDTKVISICPAAMPDTFYYLISQIRGYKYVEIRERNVNGDFSRNSIMSWGDEIVNEISSNI